MLSAPIGFGDTKEEAFENLETEVTSFIGILAKHQPIIFGGIQA